ncbi:MAG: hypothetical protein DWQ01_15240 [Planctomycetota bacterium]|nr:MAG: hypothetical protein DWQ01_15240 [Planctomycetota bacterium]
MKLRLHLLAFAAIATGAPALAQDTTDSLERALADLNSGLVVPQGTNTVRADRSTSLGISGEARIRNTWINPSGAASDQKNVDARLHLNFDFDVNEGASAHVQLNAHENWGNPGIGPNVATGEGAPIPGGGNLNAGSINEAYFSANDLFGDGGTFTAGRKRYTIGAGRILASDDWNQLPASYSGVWYAHPAEGWNVNVFMITDFFNAAGVNGPFFGTGDTDLWGGHFTWETGELPGVGVLSFTPYVLRLTTQGVATGTTMWYGAMVSGEVDIVSFDGELVFVDSDRNRAPSTSDFNAWAVDVDVDLGEWASDLPGNVSPVLELGVAQADANGVAVTPAYHNVAGIYDVQRRAGAPGVWGGAADTWQAGIMLEPMETWETRFQYIHFDDSTGTGALDASEVDVSVTKQLNSGVSMWLGWAWVDFNQRSSDAYIIYANISLPF